MLNCPGSRPRCDEEKMMAVKRRNSTKHGIGKSAVVARSSGERSTSLECSGESTKVVDAMEDGRRAVLRLAPIVASVTAANCHRNDSDRQLSMGGATQIQTPWYWKHTHKDAVVQEHPCIADARGGTSVCTGTRSRSSITLRQFPSSHCSACLRRQSSRSLLTSRS